MAATIVIALSLGEVRFLFCVTTLGLLASVVGVLCARLGKKGIPPRAERRHLSHLRCVRGAHFHRLPCFRL